MQRRASSRPRVPPDLGRLSDLTEADLPPTGPPQSGCTTAHHRPPRLISRLQGTFRLIISWTFIIGPRA
jgi:hypothetical protein